MSTERWLQELMLQLEHPSPDRWQGQNLQEARPAIQRYQLQQLLAQRQRRIQDCRRRSNSCAFSSGRAKPPSPIHGEAPPAVESPLPSIFS